jgi:hypothetical protein
MAAPGLDPGVVTAIHAFFTQPLGVDDAAMLGVNLTGFFRISSTAAMNVV